MQGRLIYQSHCLCGGKSFPIPTPQPRHCSLSRVRAERRVVMPPVLLALSCSLCPVTTSLRHYVTTSLRYCGTAVLRYCGTAALYSNSIGSTDFSVVIQQTVFTFVIVAPPVRPRVIPLQLVFIFFFRRSRRRRAPSLSVDQLLSVDQYLSGVPPDRFRIEP